uniref:Ig-like domain-containing protein n=1 Tax=Biomphalaria glabrata TaxID=6526 RepID=A0A2C9KX84_BIOGL
MGLRWAILHSIVLLICLVRESTQQVRINIFTISVKPNTARDTASYYCQVDNFNTSLPPPISFTFFAISRKTFNESEFSRLVLIEPPKDSIVPKLTTLFPPSKRWTASLETADLNSSSLSVRLTITDFQCEDVGFYRCLIAVHNETDLYQTNGSNFTATASVTIDLSLEPYNGTEEFSSTNQAGTNVTLTCNVTGPPNTKIVWKSKQMSSDGTGFQENDVVFNPETFETQLTNTSGCAVKTYSSILHKTLRKEDNGTIYYCWATDAQGKEIDLKHFITWIQSNGASVLDTKQSLAVVLFVCIFNSFSPK